MNDVEALWMEFKRQFPKRKPMTLNALATVFPSSYWEVIEIIFRETIRLQAGEKSK